MVHFTVTYNLASITKMGYRDCDNDNKFVKVRGVVYDDDDGKENPSAMQDPQAYAPQAQDPSAPSLAQVIEVLGQIQLNLDHLNLRFNFMDECLDSMVAHLALVDRKVSLGTNIDELHADSLQSFEATHSPPHT